MKKSVLIALIIVGIFLVAFGFKNLSNFTGNAVQQSCVDSDEDNTFVKGNITYVNVLGRRGVLFDVCATDGVTVQEKRCTSSPTTSPYSENHRCATACFNGACEKAKACRDYDGSTTLEKSYYTKSYVDYTKDNWKDGSSYYEFYDECHIENTDGDSLITNCSGVDCILVESVCNDFWNEEGILDSYTTSRYHCPKGCAYGKCL